jgi:DNA-directed RNA polymerase specialized sigma24 family protein
MRPWLAARSAAFRHCHLVEQWYRRYNTSLRSWLQKCYPRADHGLVEDAVADSFIFALESPAVFARAMQAGGERAVRRLLRLIAWRNLRGHFRKKATRLERTSTDAADRSDTMTPHELVSGQQTARCVFDLVDVAAVRFGGGRSDALRTALHDRLGGITDAEAARAHGLPREYVNRAKRWIGSQLEAT